MVGGEKVLAPLGRRHKEGLVRGVLTFREFRMFSGTVLDFLGVLERKRKNNIGYGIIGYQESSGFVEKKISRKRGKGYACRIYKRHD